METELSLPGSGEGAIREPMRARPRYFAKRIHSIRCALNGLMLLVRTEPNMRIHVAATVLVILVGGSLRLASWEWCWLVLAIVSMWSAEAMNTAIERVADAVTIERHPLIGQAKDVAAAAVVLTAMGSATIGLLVMGPHLWMLFHG